MGCLCSNIYTFYWNQDIDYKSLSAIYNKVAMTFESVYLNT